MTDLNPWAIAAATVASFAFSGAWYAVLGSRLSRLSDAYRDDTRPPAATVVIELVRGLLVTSGVALLVRWTGVEGVAQLLGLATVLVIAFPIVLLWGSVWHERVPLALAAIHGGDWVAKLTIVTLIVGLWR